MDALIAAVPMEQWVAVVERALQDARRGDAKAREWLSRYLLPADGAAQREDGAETTTTTGPTTFVFKIAERPTAPPPEPGDSV